MVATARSWRISAHEIRIYEVARRADRWLTAREIAALADVADRGPRPFPV